MSKIQEIKKKKHTQYTITIPKAIVKLFDLKKGDKLHFGINRHKEIVLKVEHG